MAEISIFPPRGRRATSTVAVKVSVGAITSSPGPMPSASSARCRPAVAEFTDAENAFLADRFTGHPDVPPLLEGAGAGEGAAAGVAALFVPFPHAVDDHQTTNARFLADKGAATLIDQRELSVETLAEWLRRQTRESLLAMGEKARALAKPDATEQVARVCAALAKD